MSPSLQSILGTGTLAAFETAGTVASGLPAAAYTSEAFFALETERIFSMSWVFAGFAHELARPGDVAPVTVAGQPVLLVRDAKRRIRAFHNVCRHRCLKLVDEPGNVGRTIRCPYHSWTYGLDGALHVAPYFGGRDPRAVPAGFDRAEHGLVPVRSETWHDWIFVDLGGTAPPLEDFVAPLIDRLDGFDLTRIQHLATIDFGEVAANWKLLMENFIEPYHVQFVHSTTTEQPLVDHYTVNEPGCLGCAVDVAATAARDDTLSADSRFLTLFPNSSSASTSGPNRRAPRRAAGAGPDASTPRDLQPHSAARVGHPHRAAHDALARGAPGGPRHLRAAPAGACAGSRPAAAWTLAGVGRFVRSFRSSLGHLR